MAALKVATTCLHWSQPIVPNSPSSSQALASAISSPSSTKRRSPLLLGCVRSSLFGTQPTGLCRSRSCEFPKSRIRSIKRACSANLNAYSDEEFSKKIQELALRFQLSEDDDLDHIMDSETEVDSDPKQNQGEEESSSAVNFVRDKNQFPWPELRLEPQDWRPGRDEMVPASIERKANSVDLPLSLRIIQRKLQWQEGFREAGESAYCSVKKAFSSMVFIIRELHSYTLQMREFLFYEDLQGILNRVQKEMHASFVWLFQQVFSHTPTLMVYVMILLANFTVYSMGHNAAIAASPPPGTYSSTAESASVVDVQDQKSHKFDSSAIKTFSVSSSSSSGKTTSVGGNNGSGGKARPVASGTDGDGRFDGSDHYQRIVPDGASQLSSSSSFGSTREAESVSGEESVEEEVTLWNSIVEEAKNLQWAFRGEALDQETVRRFVSPVDAKIEADDDYAEYFRTELLYQTFLSQEPNNPLLLANFAQFLHLVNRDYDR